ncbi:MAG: hypothetical protein P4L33_03365 [Capsulimonadaceae bacterium]|nr:hypothetical protein [Capsulimonadaceae bacterium]
MHWNSVGYAALCVIVPAAWGLLVYGATVLIERRLKPSKRARANEDRPAEPPSLPIDYHI